MKECQEREWRKDKEHYWRKYSGVCLRTVARSANALKVSKASLLD